MERKEHKDLPYCLLDWNPSKQNITLENLDEGANVDHTSGKLFSLTSDLVNTSRELVRNETIKLVDARAPDFTCSPDKDSLGQR